MPTLSAFGNGRGAVFDVVMEPHPTGDCGRPRWRIASITVAGGTDYSNNSLLTIVPAAGDATATAAVARVKSAGGVPQSVTIQNRGAYYRPTTGDRDYPIVTAETDGGAKLGVALERIDGEPAEWRVSYVSVLLPGSGLTTGANVTFTTGDRTVEASAAQATVVADDDGKAVAVTLAQGGRYYRNTDIPARVIEPTFTIWGNPDAVVRGVVDDDFDSLTFGQVTSLEIENFGNVVSGKEFAIGNASLNGLSVVVRAEESDSLVTLCVSSCFGSGALLQPAQRVPPVLLAFLKDAPFLVPYQVSIEVIPGSDPRLWRVSDLEFTGFNFPATEAGREIIIQPVLGTKTTTVTQALAILNQDGNALITNPGSFFSSDTEFWDGVPGPLDDVELVAGGSGYARFGRLAPTSLSASADGSTPMPVSTTEKTDDCGLPYWEVDAIAPLGSDVTDRLAIGVVRDFSDSVELQAVAIVTTRQEPTVAVSIPEEIEQTEEAVLNLTLQKTEMVIPPRTTVTPGAIANDVSPAYWSVGNIEIKNPGLGYPYLTPLEFEVTAGTEAKPASAYALADREGRIVSVTIEARGEFFLDNKVPQEVKVLQPGIYYKEDSSLAPYVSTPTVSLTQIPPSSGSGAVVTVEVDSDTDSPTFGQIISASVPQRGTGYQMRSGPRPNVFTGGVNWQGSGIQLTATPRGLTAFITPGFNDDTGLPPPTAVFFNMANKRAGVNCSDWFTNPLTPISVTSAGSIKADPGGEYTP